LVGTPSPSRNGVEAMACTLVKRHASSRVVGKPMAWNRARPCSRSVRTRAGAASPRPRTKRSCSARYGTCRSSRV